MKIKFKTSIAGLDFVYGGGEVIDLPTADAQYWIREGYATEFKEDKKPGAQRPLEVQEVKKVDTRPVAKKATAKKPVTKKK